MTLTPLPNSYTATREALHQVAFFAVSPARFKAVGRMGLTATPGGFGTPEFEGRVARVDGTLLIDEQDGNVASQEITTIREASEFYGHPYEVDWFQDWHDPLRPSDPDHALEVNSEAAHAVGAWFDFGVSVLTELGTHGTERDDVSEVQLWPEHFDPATELGDHDLGQRASFGASPGDPAHAEPYLYVAAWSEIDRSNPYWNDDAFNGGGLSYQDLLATDDPHGRAMEFLLDGYRILHAS